MAKDMFTEKDLKQKYNQLLSQYNAMEDGSTAIVKVPSFIKINKELRSTAIAIVGLYGQNATMRDVLAHFPNGELVKGFQI